jgi:hypothetical protein
MSADPQSKPHTIQFEVDGEPVETAEKTLTPTQILGLAGVDASTHYLVQVEGRHQTSYQDKPNEPIHIHEKQKFITVATGPTPVS